MSHLYIVACHLRERSDPNYALDIGQARGFFLQAESRTPELLVPITGFHRAKARLHLSFFFTKTIP